MTNMYVTTNSALVWKRMADESQHSARLMAHIVVGLLILLVTTGAYAYATHTRYNDLCHTIEVRTEKTSVPSAQMLGQSIASSYCS